VTGESGSDTVDAYVPVLNMGATTACLTASLQAPSTGRLVMTGSRKVRVAPKSVARLKLTFSGLKQLRKSAEGTVVITGGSVPVAEDVRISPGLQPEYDWPLDVVLGAAALGLVTMMGVALVTKRRHSGFLGKAAPRPRFSFDSWATQLTAVGAILGTTLGAATLPALPRQVSQQSLIGLSVLFGAVAITAPFVFQAIRSPSAPDAELNGFGVTVLATCGLTLTAVLGQLAALCLAGWEIVEGGAGGTVIVAAVIVVMILAIYYVAVTAYASVTTDWPTAVMKARDQRIPGRVRTFSVETLTDTGQVVGTAPMQPAAPITWRLP
jgi:hypothetical protein